MFEQMLAKLEERPSHGPTSTVSSVAIVGAEPIGLSLACAALSAGIDVTLHSPFGVESRKLTDAKELVVEGGGLDGSYAVVGGEEMSRAPAIRVVPELDLAIRDADAVIFAIPANLHATYASLIAPAIRPHQAIVLVPGRTFGALEVARVLRTQRTKNDIAVMELCAAPYLATQPQPGRVVIEGRHEVVLAASLSNSTTRTWVSALQPLMPMLRAASGVLETSFNNMAGLLVAAPALLSASAPGKATLRDRLPDQLLHSVIPLLDSERRRAAFAYGVRDLATFPEWLETSFATTEKDTGNALDEVIAYQLLPAPAAGDAAVRDAVATCLVPFASAGEAAGVAMPTTSALVSIASAVHGFDHARHGRTLAGLGMNRMRPDEIRRALDGADSALVQEVLSS